jgi:hypothetical protein
MLERELLLRRCVRHDGTTDGKVAAFKEWCHHFAKIKRPDGVFPFDLRPSQEATARAILNDEDVIILKSRQTGFSTLLSNLSLWEGLSSEGCEIVMLSMNEREARRLLSHAKFAYRRLPSWVKNRLPSLLDNNLERMTFQNDSILESLPSREDAARGRTVRRLIADEFASLKDQEEAWAAMDAATDIGGNSIILSTAKGAGDLFETLWVRASAGESDMTPLFWSWREAFDEAWYENKKATTLPWILAQEHPTTAEEAFVRSGNSVFDIDRLRAMEPSPPDEFEILYTKPQTGELVSATKGSLHVWEMPQPKTAYVAGVDTAEGLEHGDRSVITVLKVPTGEMVARMVGRAEPWRFAEQCSELCWLYNTALMGPERNNTGHAFIRAAVEWGYPKIFKHLRAQTKREKPTEILGWLTSRTTKAHIISELDHYTVDHEIPDELTIFEMMRYVRDEAGRMGGSPYDDCVMAFAIAVEMLAHAYEPQYKEVERKPGPWTYGWWMDKMDREERPFGKRRIGSRSYREAVR